MVQLYLTQIIMICCCCCILSPLSKQQREVKNNNKGFARFIGFTTSITAEFWALRDGLLLADQIGVQNLVIELDAKVGWS